MQKVPTSASGSRFSDPTERREVKIWDIVVSNEVKQVL